MNRIVMISPMDYMRCKTIQDLLGVSGAKEIGITIEELEYWVHDTLPPAPPVKDTDAVSWVTIHPNVWEPPRPAFTLDVRKEFQEKYKFKSLVFHAS